MDATSNLIEDYLRLGLRFGRLVDGYVDAYTGDPALRQQVLAEPTPSAAELAGQAGQLRERLDDAELEPPRRSFLAAHLDALALSGRRLAGDQISFQDEVRGYFQVDIELTDTDVYAAAHDAIDGLLPGPGAVDDRLRAHRERELCPPEQVETAVRALAGALRDCVREPTGLPAAEHIDFEIERDVAWSGFNYYLGDFRSRVAVNADASHRMSQLPVLVAHECYPGHHTEHCRKEDLLVRGAGHAEHTIFLVNTPSSVMAEGLGDLALTAALGAGWATWAAEVLSGIGPGLVDPDVAEALEIAARPLNSVRQNAALLLHSGQVGVDDAVAYLQRWSLVDEKRARQQVRFATDPLWRAYTSTYVEGERLLRPWLEGRPAGVSALDRFRRLLDEPLTPADIRRELPAPGVP